MAPTLSVLLASAWSGVATAWSGAPARSFAPVRDVIEVPGWPSHKGFPLSFGTKADGVIYASGLTGMDMSTLKPVPGGVIAETHQALLNLKELLGAAGSSLDRVTGCSVLLVNMTQDFKAMNEAYATFWPQDPPSRVAVQVGSLAGSSAVEIQCTAVMPGVDREVVPVPGLPPLKGFPLSFTVKGGNLVYASGMQGFDTKTMKLVSGGAAAETRQTMSNIQLMLEAAGSSLEKAVSCEVSLTDLADFQAVNEVYKSFWPTGNYPSRVCVKVTALAGGAAVEVRCTAAGSSIDKEVVPVPGWQVSSAPISSIVKAGKFAFVSGMLGMDMQAMKLVPGGIANETAQALGNIRTAVAAAGGRMEDITLCEVSLKDIKDFKAMNDAYSKFWAVDPPARVTTQAGGLLAGAAVEIRCVVALGGGATIVV